MTSQVNSTISRRHLLMLWRFPRKMTAALARMHHCSFTMPLTHCQELQLTLYRCFSWQSTGTPQWLLLQYSLQEHWPKGAVAFIFISRTLAQGGRRAITSDRRDMLEASRQSQNDSVGRVFPLNHTTFLIFGSAMTPHCSRALGLGHVTPYCLSNRANRRGQRHQVSF